MLGELAVKESGPLLGVVPAARRYAEVLQHRPVHPAQAPDFRASNRFTVLSRLIAPSQPCPLRPAQIGGQFPELRRFTPLADVFCATKGLYGIALDGVVSGFCVR